MDVVTDIQVRDPLQIAWLGSTALLTFADVEPIWAKLVASFAPITVADGTTRTPYQWRKQKPAGGGNFTDSDDTVEGYNPANSPLQWPAFASDNLPATLGSVVRLYPSVADPNPDPTVNHGLEWFWVAPGGPKGSTLRILDWSIFDPARPPGTYPAVLQTYSTSGHSYVDASAVRVYVRDPNGDNFRPDEIVSAQYVETYPTVGGVDVYERTGLDAPTIYVTGPGQYPSLFTANVYPAARFIDLHYPAYSGNPHYPNSPGVVNVSLAPSTNQTQGILQGFPGYSAPSNYDGSDPYRENSIYQWARGGYTGFDYLLTHGTIYGDGNPPNGPGSGVPTDADIATNFTSAGTATVSGNGSHYTVAIGFGQGFNIASAGGINGTVSWGGTASFMVYDRFDVYTRGFSVSTPGFSPGSSPANLCWIQLGTEIGTTNGSFCFVGGRPTQISSTESWATGIGTLSGSLSFTHINNGINNFGGNAYLGSSGVVFVGGNVQLGTLGGGVLGDIINVVGQLGTPDPQGQGNSPTLGQSLYGPPLFHQGNPIFINGLYVASPLGPGLAVVAGLRPGPDSDQPVGQGGYVSVQTHVSNQPSYWVQDGTTII
jgi:hypothetical protein